MKKSLILFPLALLWHLPSMADDDPTQKKFYLGAYGAHSSSFKKDPIENYTISSQSTSITGLRLVTGYQITDNWGIELGYTRRTKYTQDAYNNNNPNISYHAQVKTINKDISLIYKFTQYVPGLFVLTGYTWTQYHLNADLHIYNQTMPVKTKISNKRFEWGIGYEHKLTESIHWNIGYSHYGEDKILFLGLKKYL